MFIVCALIVRARVRTGTFISCCRDWRTWTYWTASVRTRPRKAQTRTAAAVRANRTRWQPVVLQNTTAAWGSARHYRQTTAWRTITVSQWRHLVNTTTSFRLCCVEYLIYLHDPTLLPSVYLSTCGISTRIATLSLTLYLL